MLGSTLDDRYQIVRRIARGGMATVFEAVDLRLSRTVAVKVMHPGLDADSAIAARFDTEARAAALLAHPNVVAVFDSGRDDGRPYIVMEYVRGITLRQLITLEAPFVPAQALQLYEPVVSALAAAHAAGIIHRDVKPENVLISERGQVKVADFGLAREVNAATVADGGVVLGTVSYIAPELVSHGHASTRSDVYSLGILLYELLTGLKPYRGATPIEVAYAHVHRNVPLPSAVEKVSDQVPSFLDTLVQTTTSRSLSVRQTDAGVLLRQVRAARDAVAHGVADPAALRAVMRARTPEGVDAAARRLPRPLASGMSAVSAASASVLETGGIPALAEHSAPLASPAATLVEDAPRPASPGPISPYSPPSRPPRLPRPSGWEQSPMHRRRRLTVAVASAILVAGLTFGGWWVVAGRLPAIPTTAGLEQAAAAQAVSGAGLSVQFVREFSESVPAGVAIRSEPSAGSRLDPGATVVVYLSSGPHLYDVPSLRGMSRDDATRALTDAGLSVGTITEAYDVKVPAGRVLSQGTAAGLGLHRGGAVDFVVSLGAEPVDWADWTGKPLADAKQAASASGLKVKTNDAPSATVPKGMVLSQTPAAGQAHRGDTVTLVVSSGPGTVAMPEVRRLDAASATAKLQSAGFTVTVAAAVKPAAVPGTVVSTNPLTGNRVQAGATVTIYVG